MKSQLDHARELQALGFCVLPLEHRAKAPRIVGWEQVRISFDDLPKYFADRPGNIGCVLGLDGITDIDLDCPEACAIADVYLQQTGCVFGRQSAPKSHRVYRLAQGGIPSLKIVDPIDRGSGKSTIVELRCLKKDGSVGLQTVMAGHHKDTGEPIDFFHGYGGIPAEVDSETLIKAVKYIGATVLLYRNEPGEGKRNEYFLALGGTLARHAWEFDEAYKLMFSLWSLIWPNAVDQQECKAVLRSTYGKVEAGGETTGIPKLRELIANKKSASMILDLLGISADEKEDKARRSGRREQETNEMEKLLQGVQFFTDRKDPFARIEVNGHNECWIVTSDRFRQILLARYYETHQALPGKEALQDVISLCAFRAAQGPICEVFSRIGHAVGADEERKVFLDLADEGWRSVEVTSAGWRVVNDPPIYFRRPGGMLPLPTPEPGGSLDELRPLINASSETTWLLICTWLASVFQPIGAQPILLLAGSQGSAKSTTATLLRKLIDPNMVPLSGPPESARDFSILCLNSGVPALDNLSGVRPWLSDAMCRVASGAGFRTRSLYRDAEEQVLQLRKPLLLNGIDSIERNDLIDRCLSLTLERISDANRRTEREIYEAFDKSHPRILGALLSVVSAGLKNICTTKLVSAPRMVDFAHWAVACEPALPWEQGRFLEIYSHNRFEASEDAVSDDPFASAVTGLAQAFKDRVSWCGTAQNLLEVLNANDGYRSERWPRDASAVGRWLKRAEPGLRALGVIIEHRREGKDRARKIAIRYEPPVPKEPSDGQGAAVADLTFEFDEAA